jgi:N-acetylmuramoyl-L-alanine amidase
VEIANKYFEKVNGKSGEFVFISIHLNKAPNKNARGYEIYWLGNDASEDSEIINLVVSENSSDESAGLKFVNGEDFDFLSIIQFETAKDSSAALADCIGRNMKTETGLPNRKVKPARFRVLHNYKMPAVLVEVGFLSNYTDANLLGTSRFQERAALALYKGIGEFFKDEDDNFQLKSIKPVIVEAPETLIYTVKKGDTISGISKKYGISERELKRINGLQSNKIFVGQKLKVNSIQAGG